MTVECTQAYTHHKHSLGEVPVHEDSYAHTSVPGTQSSTTADDKSAPFSFVLCFECSKYFVCILLYFLAVGYD